MNFIVTSEVQNGLQLFREKELCLELFEQEKKVIGYPLETIEKTLIVEFIGDELHISYSELVLFFRGLFTIYPRMLVNDEKKRIESTTIEEIAVSLDFSRNAIMTVDKVETYLLYLAAVGANTLYLYTEDTYEVAEEKYFGYLRGRYSVLEIQSIVKSAERLGIEVVPAIQTLAHLTQFLRWPMMEEMKEDAHTLLIDEGKSYAAIQRMINACKKMYKSKRIHLGMDEAYQAGLGRYLDIHGFVPRVELMLRHLEKVVEMVKTSGLEPIIWSDFVYKMLDMTNTSRLYYPGAEMNPEYSSKYPKDLTYVHWDYGCEDVEQYKKVIMNHLEFCDKDRYMLATGAHIFGKIAPNHGKSINIITAGIRACKELELNRVMLTTWGDDGQETEHVHALISLYYYCETIYSDDVITKDIENSMDNLLGNGAYQFLYDLTYFDEVFGIEKGNPMMGNISRSVLWQDPLLGIYDKHIALYNQKYEKSLGNYYHELAKKLKNNKYVDDGIFMLIKQRYILLAEVLSLKADLGIYLQNARQMENKAEFERIQLLMIEPLILKFKALYENHEQVWEYFYKANGWEVLERRYAASISRLKTTSRKINRYIENGEGLDELLEEKLLFCNVDHPLEFSGFNYRDTASSGYN